MLYILSGFYFISAQAYVFNGPITIAPSILRHHKNQSGIRGSEKAGLKLNIQKTKIMASGPITSWQTDGETMETVTDFILGAPKSLQMVTKAMKLKDAYFLERKL